MPSRRPAARRLAARHTVARRLAAATASATDRSRYGVEVLEERRLLTTLSAGAGLQGQFTFLDQNLQRALITYSDVTFEAVGSIFDPLTATTTATDLIQPSNPPPPLGSNLYKIYVTSSHADSLISVTALDAMGNPIPYAGTTPGFIITDLNAPFARRAVAVTAPAGSLFMGALNTVAAPGPALIPNIPLQQSVGLQPAPAGGLLTPGIQVLPVDPATDLQNDFGSFLFGGTVTGTVSFGGNVGLFYAGAVLTGATGGRPLQAMPTSATPATANFTVGGDLREFITSGPVGGDGSGGPATPGYVTGFDLHVGGSIGELRVGTTSPSIGEGAGAASLYGVVQADNSRLVSGQDPSTATTADPFPVKGLLTPALETETVPASNVVGAGFPNGQLDFRNENQYVPGSTNVGGRPGGIPADVQMLGSVPVLDPVTGVPVRDTSGYIIYQASVRGRLQGTVNPQPADTIDRYGLGLEAGRTITVTTGAPTLEIIDPDGRMVASNLKSGGGPLRYTPTRPGVYTFELTEPTPAAVPYLLTITNSGNLGIGAIVVNGGINDLGFDGGIVGSDGDVGAVVSATQISSLTTGPTPNPDATVPLMAPTSISVPGGNLRAVEAGQIGMRTVANPAILGDGPYLSVPNGAVGLIAAFGNLPAFEGVLNVHSQFDPNYLALGTPQFVTDDANAHAIGGPIEVVDALSTYEGELATDRGLGTLHAGDLATNTPSFFDVNADDLGQDGIIDLIDVPLGSFGNGVGGGPGFVTHTGGDIRYLNVNPAATFLDNQFGGGADTATTYPIAQVATVTDDSGARVSLTPVGQQTLTNGTVVTGSPITTVPTPSNTSTLYSAGPQISLLTYPVRDKGGLVTIAATSTGGLIVTGNGTSGAANDVEFADLTVTGAGRAVVRTGNFDQYGNATIFQPDPNDPNANANAGVITRGLPGDTGTTTNSPAAVTTHNASTGTTTAGGTGSSTANGNGTTGVGGPVTNPTGGALTSSGTILPGASAIDVLTGTGTSRLATAENSATDLILILQGSATIDVLGITTASSAVTIADTTPGEVVRLQAPGVGTIQVKGNLGFATPHATPAAVAPRVVAPNGDTYPFLYQTTGVVIGTGFLDAGGTAAGVTGYAVNVAVGGGIGNFQAGLTVQNLAVDYDNTPTPGQVDGVVGPVVVGRLLNADVGEGVLPVGTGNVGYGGLFATYKISTVDNYGHPNGDLRGSVVSAEYDQVTNLGIDTIQVRNASIIGAAISTTLPPPLGMPFGNTFFNPEPQSGNPNLNASNNANQQNFSTPFRYDIGSITVVGAGGIIGTVVHSQDIGPVTVTGGGFGILNSQLVTGAGGRIADVVASGYGLRDSLVNGRYVGPITLTGNGSSIPTTAYPIDVRPSDLNQGNGRGTFDPYFDFVPDNTIDVNAELGTAGQFPSIANVTDTGVLQDDTIQADADFAGVAANVARTALAPINPANVLPQPDVPNFPIVAVLFANSITVGGNVGYVRIFGLIDGLQVTAGRLNQFRPNTNVNRLGLSVAGPIASLQIHGNLGELAEDYRTGLLVPDSYVQATGPSGTIGNLNVRGSIFANVLANASLKTLNVTGDLTGSVTVNGKTTAQSVGTIRVGGAIRDGSLNVAGRVGSIVVNDGLGTSTGSLLVSGSANLISIGADHRHRGSTLALALTVDGSLNTLRVFGSVTGSVHVLGDLRNLNVFNDGTTTNAIAGNVTVDGHLYNAQIQNGNVAGTIDSNLDLYNFNLTRGSLLAGATVQTNIAAIHTFRIGGGSQYNLDGSVISAAGGDLRLSVAGRLGDGTDVARVQAISGSTFAVGGSIQSGAIVSVAQRLESLVVGGDVQAGATVTANPLVNRRVRGTDASA